MQFAPLSISNSWLSAVNPLRGLTMSRGVAELESGMRGDYAMLQWLYQFIEKRDATLRGAKRRIRASLLKLDWNIKVRAGLDANAKARAEAQQKALRAEYEKIENLRKALAHLGSAEFRGFAHLEKHFAGGSIVKLEPVPQWHFCRDGIYGAWRFQENAMGGINGDEIDPAGWVIREIDDPINEIALIAFTRKGLSSKDFDAFIARYGIPFVFWILSESMAALLANDPTKMGEWMQIMRGIGSDGEGIIPGGTLETLEAGGGGKDQNPFLQHLGYQDEQIVMAATSGKLTMLNDAAGLGGSNSDTHADTFDEIALALAMEISETLQEQIDGPTLDRLFPGEPHLVYFELAAQDAEDVTAIVGHAKTLSEAGMDMDVADVAERTGYKLVRKTQDLKTQDPRQEAVARNREVAPAAVANDGSAAEDELVRKAAAGILKGFGEVASAVLGAGDDDLTKAFGEAVETAN